MPHATPVGPARIHRAVVGPAYAPASPDSQGLTRFRRKGQRRMRLRRVTISNFRCYRDETALEVDDFTALIGANDVGKSTFLDALAIFFGQAKPDDRDGCLWGDPSQANITCEFDDLPDEVLIDSTTKTSLTDEFLLNAEGRLQLSQTWNCTLKTPKVKQQIIAVHPSAPDAIDLLRLKRNELKQRALDLGVDLSGVNETVNAELRQAIRSHIPDLKPILQQIEVDLEGTKEIVPKLLEHLPAFFLFRADRPSTDQDAEAQDPMKIAVRLAIEEQRSALDKIAAAVMAEVQDLAGRTLDRVREMAPELAAELSPQLSPPRWDSVFKFSLTSEAEIPLNKRGSGVRRLILLGFLQAQAEAHRLESPERGLIYAIEEPETSQHPDKQRAMLEALREIAEQDGYQVLMTTHTPNLARVLPTDRLQFIARDGETRTVHSGADADTLEKIRTALGVHPDHDVRLFVGVEGLHDESFLINISTVLAETDPTIAPLQNLIDQGRVIFIPEGGSNLAIWVARLKNLNCAEFHLFDRDNEPPAKAHYAEEADEINARAEASARHTSKRELENYLHPDAIQAAEPSCILKGVGDFDDLPMVIAEMLFETEHPGEWPTLSAKARKRQAGRAKHWLNTNAARHMTPELLEERGALDEVSEWLREITRIAQS
jgi:putative ATP-dependent endonuclease of OLD family